jgi:hypothetical protein
MFHGAIEFIVVAATGIDNTNFGMGLGVTIDEGGK